MTRREVIALGAAAAVSSSSAQGADWHKSEAFQRAYNLDYDAALQLVEKEAAQSPNDAESWNQMAYTLLYRALFAADALDGAAALNAGAFLRKPKVPFSAEERQRFEGALEKSMALSQAKLNSNPKDALALYNMGVAKVHRASYLFLIQKEWREALKSGSDARRLHTQAHESDSSLADALLVPSIHQYVVGSLPIYLKALTFLVGLSGDKKKGLEGLRNLAAQGRRTRVEASVLLAVAESREENFEAAAQILWKLAAEFPSNHLYRMELVKVLAKMKRRNDATRELSQLSEARYRFLKAEKLNAFRGTVQTLLKA
jgi:hypothetical protein